ncbi:Hypothetical Protein FCC1311_027732 [Hondaea fermentalgiana]|uniref:Fibronectin type-II domain-containing protein n=1 Tax=Hondaea fermentalgiana TaxID=2315210 RepID=A0A2R5G668_9STRA|nr:Hypothetical Protein FCC1311_027732 [Hondaea fermentalgiana]|eukprot:GBG26552.1 Hypothetical Protein FCC1311_027732 [Hondaea fermentalgiana]
MCELDSDCMQDTLCVNEGRCRAIVNVTYVNIVAQASENLRSAPLAVMKSLQEGVSEALQNSSLQASSIVIEPSDADTSTPLCTTDGGWVPDGSSCAFPFTFQGRTYASCVDVEDATPYWGNETTAPPGTPPVLYRVYWCPTTQEYSKSDPATREQWGYCDCGRSWPTAYPTARPTTHAPTIELEKDRPIWCDEALRNENATQDLQAQVLSALQGNATTGEVSGFLFNLQGPLSGLGDEVGAEDPQEGDLTVALVIDVGAQEFTSREDFLASLASTLIDALRTPFRNETLHEICDAVS